MKLAVKPFTLVGATTRSGLLSSPLRDRFGQHYHLDFSSHGELSQIIQRSAHLLEVRIDDASATELAARARSTPRIPNRLLRRVRDFAEVNAAQIVTSDVALGALELLEIDACGFDKMDRAILSAIIDKFDGARSGLKPWRRQSVRKLIPSATFTNPIYCRKDSSPGRRAAGSPPSGRIRILDGPAGECCCSLKRLSLPCAAASRWQKSGIFSPPDSASPPCFSPNYRPRYNITPRQEHFIVTTEYENRKLTRAKSGLLSAPGNHGRKRYSIMPGLKP